MEESGGGVDIAEGAMFGCSMYIQEMTCLELHKLPSGESGIKLDRSHRRRYEASTSRGEVDRSNLY